jgi:allantoinase
MDFIDLILESRRVVTPEGVRPASIHIAGGRIARLGDLGETSEGVPAIDCGDLAVLPGVVDTHVHVNEPGRTEWEGFDSATRAAAAGGITALVDMPLNCIPATTSAAALVAKRRAAAGRCWVDVGFWGGAVPGNAGELAALWDAGVLGFKAFLVPSGVPEFEAVGEDDLRTAMRELARLGAPLLAHAESPGPIDAAAGVWEGVGAGRLRQYRRYLASRPDAAEVAAIELLLRLARETGCRLHIVHLATATALPALAAAWREGLPVTVESCPHYLTFAAEEIPDGGVAFKCAPPIRGRDTRERLWQALGEGVIDLVASDHSPSPPESKAIETGDFRAAWGGIASLELALPAVWTAARERGFGLADLARWLSSAPACLAGVAGRKGEIAAGRDADLVVFDPEASFTVDPAALHQRHKLTPYAGRTLHGVVRRTLLGGETVYHDGRFGDRPRGRWLSRSAG